MHQKAASVAKPDKDDKSVPARSLGNAGCNVNPINGLVIRQRKFGLLMLASIVHNLVVS
jgi:hypothetical protein